MYRRSIGLLNVQYTTFVPSMSVVLYDFDFNFVNRPFIINTWLAKSTNKYVHILTYMYADTQTQIHTNVQMKIHTCDT